MLSHALQTARRAAEAGEDEETVLGCAYHDTGHLGEVADYMGESKLAVMESAALGDVGMDDHDKRGRDFLLRMGFSLRVAAIPGNHVEAKRYLVATNHTYMSELSLASQETLKLQGGPMTPLQVTCTVYAGTSSTGVHGMGYCSFTKI